MILSTRRLHPLTRLDAALASLVGLACLVLYVRTLVPGLLSGDSGELQTVVYSLGMTHPTGYPVYVLLGHLFTLLPLGDMAWRVNLFSAVFAAITIASVYLIVRLLSGWRLAAVTAAIVLGISPLFWYFSVIAELYVPACAFLSVVILFLLLWRQTGKWTWLAASAMLGGLSLGVHSSVALAAPGVLVYLVLTTRAKKDWVAAVGGAVLGAALALAAFLFLDARDPAAGYYHATVLPSLSAWGMTASDFDSPLERLRFLYAARQFRYAMFSDPAAIMPVIASTYVDVLGLVFGPLSLTLLLAGAISLFFSRWREGLLLLLSWGIQVIFIFNYNIFDVVVFFVPTYVCLAIWIGVGAGLLMDALSAAFVVFRQPKLALPAAAIGGVLLLVLAALPRLGMVAEAWQTKAVSFMRRFQYQNAPFVFDVPVNVEGRAGAVVAAVEEDAILFTNWDMLFPYYYVAMQQGRTGIDFHETFPQEGVTRLADSAIVYVDANIDARPIYFSERPSWLAGRYNITRSGPGLFQVERE